MFSCLFAALKTDKLTYPRSTISCGLCLISLSPDATMLLSFFSFSFAMLYSSLITRMNWNKRALLFENFSCLSCCLSQLKCIFSFSKLFASASTTVYAPDAVVFVFHFCLHFHSRWCNVHLFFIFVQRVNSFSNTCTLYVSLSCILYRPTRIYVTYSSRVRRWIFNYHKRTNEVFLISLMLLAKLASREEKKRTHISNWAFKRKSLGLRSRKCTIVW